MATDYINLLNAGSGLNTKEIIDSLVEAERTPVEELITKKTEEIEVSISSFGTLKQNFSDLDTSISSLDGVTGLTISQTGTSVNAEVTDSSLFGEFSSSFEVSQIATSHTLVFDGFESESASVGSGTLTFEFGNWSNGVFSENSDLSGGNLVISDSSDSLAEVKASINAAGIGVTASILKQSDSNYALVLKSQEGADSAMRISLGKDKAVSQTTAGVLNSTAEVQSVAGFASSDLSSLNGKTLFLHDGTNSLSVDFSSTPANLAAVVTAITSATGYSDMDFTVSAGTNALTLTYNASDGDVNLADVGFLTTTETVTAVDANFTIDGVPITRTSNTISDLLDGVTLTLNNTTSSAETVSGAYDSDSAFLAFSIFVEEINTIKTSLETLTDRGGLTSDAGPLAGDPIATYFKNQLSTILNSSIPGFDDEEIYLAYFGFETQQDGSFIVNQDTFDDYFTQNPKHLSAIFTSGVSSESALISPKILGDDYTPGVYSLVFDDSGNASIGDTELTQSGNVYSSLSGDVSGLILTANTGADDTTIYVGRSLINTLSNFTTQLLATSGDIANKISDLNANLLEYQDDIDSLNDRMASLKARYNEQFGAMEAAVAAMKSTETTITNMMEAWKGSMNK